MALYRHNTSTKHTTPLGQDLTTICQHWNLYSASACLPRLVAPDGEAHTWPAAIVHHLAELSEITHDDHATAIRDLLRVRELRLKLYPESDPDLSVQDIQTVYRRHDYMLRNGVTGSERHGVNMNVPRLDAFPSPPSWKRKRITSTALVDRDREHDATVPAVVASNQYVEMEPLAPIPVHFTPQQRIAALRQREGVEAADLAYSKAFVMQRLRERSLAQTRRKISLDLLSRRHSLHPARGNCPAPRASADRCTTLSTRAKAHPLSRDVQSVIERVKEKPHLSDVTSPHSDGRLRPTSSAPIPSRLPLSRVPETLSTPSALRKAQALTERLQDDERRNLLDPDTPSRIHPHQLKYPRVLPYYPTPSSMLRLSRFAVSTQQTRLREEAATDVQKQHDAPSRAEREAVLPDRPPQKNGEQGATSHASHIKPYERARGCSRRRSCGQNPSPEPPPDEEQGPDAIDVDIAKVPYGNSILPFGDHRAIPDNLLPHRRILLLNQKMKMTRSNEEIYKFGGKKMGAERAAALAQRGQALAVQRQMFNRGVRQGLEFDRMLAEFDLVDEG